MLLNLLCSCAEKLNENHADRIRFFLSKADTAGHESDRQVKETVLTATQTAMHRGYYMGVSRYKFYF